MFAELFRKSNLFLRFFHIALIVSYFFCCHAEIIAAPFVSSSKERTFKPLKSNSNPHTESITASLPKHIHTIFQIKIDVDNQHLLTVSAPTRLLVNFYFIAHNDDIIQEYLETPPNKAPPIFSF